MNLREDDEQEMNEAFSNAYYNNASALQVRLNTEQVLDRIELFLKGSIERYGSDENGQLKRQILTIGQPLANRIGIQGILNLISMLVNPQVVQGNMDRDRYDDFIEEVNMDLADAAMCNLCEWGIQLNNYNYIIDGIMHLLIPFLSRLIDNKERDSYSTTIKSIESLNPQQTNDKKGLFGFMGGK